MQNLMQIHCSIHLVILNVTASAHAHSTASMPLTSTGKSSLFTHEHSSPLSLAASLHQWCTTVLSVLTMAGLFPDRPHILIIYDMLYFNKNLF